ncbi:hypothetical protein [Microbacterium sp. NIBRBAC000506063]|nr:hypothetical protein [Microbacterium sp. NIBRBAC000506063]
MLDAAALSHVVLWVISGMVLCTTVVVTGALVSMGRGGYRKD